MSRAFDVATSVVASALRFGAGGWVTGAARARAREEPRRPLELYEFEGCPYCRRVREALSELDLDALVYPCPKGGTRFRPRALELSPTAGARGRVRFPLLVDPNTGARLHESSDIVRYLRRTYEGSPDGSGAGVLARLGSLGAGSIASAVRMQRGVRARARGPRAGRGSEEDGPARPVELWSFEACPYCRLVREVLCELEIPYLLHNVARGSVQRGCFVELSGRMMVPYLVDPNTGARMFESADIVRYLEVTYGQ